MDFAIFKKYSINLFFKRSPNCIKVCISKLHLFGQQGFDKIILVFFHLLKIHKLLDQGIAKIYITLITMETLFSLELVRKSLLLISQKTIQ